MRTPSDLSSPWRSKRKLSRWERAVDFAVDNPFLVMLFLAALTVGLIMLVSWPVMLAFGAIHSEWAAFPAFSYWVTVAIVLVVRLLLAGVR